MTGYLKPLNNNLNTSPFLGSYLWWSHKY